MLNYSKCAASAKRQRATWYKLHEVRPDVYFLMFGFPPVLVPFHQPLALLIERPTGSHYKTNHHTSPF